jgi:redox-sensitive bicupin YhaK (pirin superfamily)
LHTKIRNYDPFLLLDYFNAGKPAGFPDHPHRGFETVTYVITGSFAHEDFVGHKGVIGPGDLQWMTAGRGIVHCEMPHGNEPGIGLQLWVNLSKQNKMIPPSYQELKDTQIPRASKNGVHVKIIAGESMGIKSPVYTRTPTMYLDFKLDKNAVYTQEIPTDWNALIFILSGKGEFGNSTPIEASAYHTLLLTKGETVSFKNNEETQLHIVLIAGQPLNEPSKDDLKSIKNK